MVFQARSKVRRYFPPLNVTWDLTTDTSNATICFTDACLGGMVYWFPQLNLGFQCRILTREDTRHIFYFEALTVTCAILDKHHQLLRFVVYTDNRNTVDIWHSLKAIAPYNNLLILGIDELIDAHVLHVPGIENAVADAISRFNNNAALKLVPKLQIFSFQPPQGTLGVPKK